MTMIAGAAPVQDRPVRQLGSRRFLVLALPLGLVFAIGFIHPLWQVLTISLGEGTSGAPEPTSFSSAQFIEVFTTPRYAELIGRTLALAGVTTLLAAILGYPLALAITRGRTTVRAVLLAVVTMPLLTSVVVKTFGWSVLLSSEGIVQQSLEVIGLGDVRLLFSPVGVTIGLLHTYMPFMVLTLVAAVGAVDRRTEEAARSLGSHGAQVFFRVTFPQTLDGLAAGSALTFVTSMSALVTPQMLGGGRVSTITTAIYEQATAAQNWPLASALGVVLLVLTLAILSLQTLVVRRACRS